MSMISHKDARRVAATAFLGIASIAVPNISAFASNNLSSTISAPGSNNTYNPLAPANTGEVGMLTARSPVPVENQKVNCHLLTGFSKGSDCR
jgi:hypothetical protein